MAALLRFHWRLKEFGRILKKIKSSIVSKSLKRNNATEWNSLYHSLFGVSEMLDEVIDLLKQKDAL